ncbi:MAG: C39 family peptidase [Patescibacteria group bacterium]
MSNHHHKHGRLERFRPHHHHRRIRKQYFALIAIMLIGTIGLLGYLNRQQLQIQFYALTKPKSLPAVSTPTATPSTNPLNTVEKPATTPIAAELNLAVPFTSQAPKGIWDESHEDFCEEASTVMAAHYFQKQPFGSPDEADAEMFKLKDWQLANFGDFKSTTAAQTKLMIEKNYPALSVALETKVDVTTIKRALNENKLVIVPAAGRELGNPFFTAPGPVYHMLVIKGYTKDGRFITNDPGTRKGADYVYDEQVLLDAVGDYNHGNPANGLQVLLIISAQ